MTMNNNSIPSPKMLSMFGMGGSMFGVVLPDFVKQYPSTKVIAADMSGPAGLDKFRKEFPEKLLNVGIAEQNMIGFASGLADEGNKCICVAQSCFITMRCYEQVRQFCGYMRIPLILVGTGGGFTLTFMGNTHYSLEDFALMRTIPGMNILCPADAYEAAQAFETALHSGKPTYIRMSGGPGIPCVVPEEYRFAIGEANILREGKDVNIIATGTMVHQALIAAGELESAGIEAQVVNMSTISPLDRSVLNHPARLTVTVEEHRLAGGLGEAVASNLAQSCSCDIRLLKIGVNDLYPFVGDYNYLLEQCGLTGNHIAKTIMSEFLKL